MAVIYKFNKQGKRTNPKVVQVPYTVRVAGLIIIFSLILSFGESENLTSFIKNFVFSGIWLTVFFLCINGIVETKYTK